MQPPERTRKPDAHRASLLGAMFLMAVSAIGPGFITQTAVFTVELGAAFAFAILVSILVDVAIQMNVWRVIGVSGLRAHELGNKVFPGAGWFLACLVIMGGIVFNIGNIAGTGLGANALLGADTKIAGAVSGIIAILVFLSKKASAVMDKTVILLGTIMILLMLYVAIVVTPPVGEAMRNMVVPEKINFLVLTTLIGGTVGGYITYAGAHRMLDSGVTGITNIPAITRSSILGILITGLMRVLLFLAVLGVVASGVTLTSENKAAEAFGYAAGRIGLWMFGVVLWVAALTSVIGAAYTSVSFITPANASPRVRNLLTAGFIAGCTVIYLFLGQSPQSLLIFAGAFNGLILPIGFTVLLWVAWRRRDLLHGYSYPKWLLLMGILVWLLTVYMGWKSLEGLAKL
jgi:Mn2+/Fe2+ NRAMP family transporter